MVLYNNDYILLEGPLQKKTEKRRLPTVTVTVQRVSPSQELERSAKSQVVFFKPPGLKIVQTQFLPADLEDS
jgi:hypothetical protein